MRHAGLAVLALVAWSTVARPAGAQEPVVTAPEELASREQFVRGKELFADGRLDDARAAFTTSRDLASENAGPHLWLGFVEEKRGDCAAAMASFDAFLARVTPTDKRIVSMAISRERCRAAMAAKFGILAVESTPAGAEVWLDGDEGAPAGITPYSNASLPIGSYTVSLRLAGHLPMSRAVALAGGETLRLALSLRPIEVPLKRSPVRLAAGAALLGAGGLLLGAGTWLQIASTDGASAADFPTVEAFEAQRQLLAASGTATLAIGGAVALAGLVVLALPPRREARPAVAVAPTLGGLRIDGAF